MTLKSNKETKNSFYRYLKYYIRILTLYYFNWILKGVLKLKIVLLYDKS